MLTFVRKVIFCVFMLWLYYVVCCDREQVWLEQHKANYICLSVIIKLPASPVQFTNKMPEWNNSVVILCFPFLSRGRIRGRGTQMDTTATRDVSHVTITVQSLSRSTDSCCRPHRHKQNICFQVIESLTFWMSCVSMAWWWICFKRMDNSLLSSQQ